MRTPIIERNWKMNKVFTKRSLILALAALFAFGCMFAFLSACSNNEKFYTLKEAYKKHYLTKADLEALATEGHNYKVSDLDMQEEIKTDYLEYYKKHFKEDSKRYPDATVDDIDIRRYWGEYNGYVVVQIYNPGSQYAGEVLKYSVAGIEIEYSGPELLVWKIDSPEKSE